MFKPTLYIFYSTICHNFLPLEHLVYNFVVEYILSKYADVNFDTVWAFLLFSKEDRRKVVGRFSTKRPVSLKRVFLFGNRDGNIPTPQKIIKCYTLRNLLIQKINSESHWLLLNFMKFSPRQKINSIGKVIYVEIVDKGHIMF